MNNDRIYSVYEIKLKLAPIAEKYEVNSILLIGSYARGDANSESDIDLVIEKGKPMGFLFASMSLELEEIFGKKVDLLDIETVKDSLIRNATKNGVIVYEKA